jgi:hypothetical protein
MRVDQVDTHTNEWLNGRIAKLLGSARDCQRVSYPVKNNL